MKKFTLPLLLALSISVFGQKSPFKFGDIDIEDLERTSSSIDSTAGAEILLSYGLTTFDFQFEIVLEHHVRLKIYNSTEFDRGNIKIPYRSGDRVSKLKAVTYNLENEKIVENKIEKGSIFDEKVNDELMQKRLSMPNVKEGSVIEYSYVVNYGGWRSLNTWYFQMDIPVQHSEYIVSLPEYFKYSQNMTGYISLADYETYSKTGSFKGATFNMDVKRFVAKNVNAFKDEPFMTSRDDYISKIKFELASVFLPNALPKYYLPGSYAELSKEYAEGSYYGTSLIRNKFLQDEIQVIAPDSLANLDRAKALYIYVRNNFEIDNDVLAEEIRRLFNIKRGYRSDINRVLVALYREAGFESDIVRISTRKHGKINPMFPMKSSLNYTITLLMLDGKEILLDPSVKGQPFGILPEKCLNGRGVLVTSDNFRWIELKPQARNQISYKGQFEMDEDGILTGNLDINRVGYNAIDFRNDHSEDIDSYKKDFEDGMASWYIDDHQIEGVGETDKDVSHTIEVEIEDQAEMAGNLIIFNPLLYAGFRKNPFETPDRLFPVNYGTPYSQTIIYSIQIPESYEIDEVPQQLAIGLPDNGGKFLYTVQHMGRNLIVNSRFSINQIEFGASEYLNLREFYAQVVAKQAENVILKLKE